MKRAAPLALLLVACAGPPQGPPEPVETPQDACAYPTAVEPMTAGETLFPYRWARAFTPDDDELTLDLAKAPCDEDESIDWSPFDTLTFISIPAW